MTLLAFYTLFCDKQIGDHLTYKTNFKITRETGKSIEVNCKEVEAFLGI